IDDTDSERLAICESYNVVSKSFYELFADQGYTTKEAAMSQSAYTALQASEANRTFRSPSSLVHRYVLEDIGHSLVVWEYLAALAKLDTPVISAQITIASSMMGDDYRKDADSIFELVPKLTDEHRLRRFLMDGE